MSLQQSDHSDGWLCFFWKTKSCIEHDAKPKGFCRRLQTEPNQISRTFHGGRLLLRRPKLLIINMMRLLRLVQTSASPDLIARRRWTPLSRGPNTRGLCSQSANNCNNWIKHPIDLFLAPSSCRSCSQLRWRLCLQSCANTGIKQRRRLCVFTSLHSNLFKSA